MVKKTVILMSAIIGLGLVTNIVFSNGVIALGNSNAEIINKDENEENPYKENIEILAKLEELDANEIEDSINKKIKDSEKIENTNSSKENGQVDFKKYYKNTIFLGDSITEFLSAEDIINENNVLAKKGNNVISAKEDIEKIKIANPDNIIILLGMNDILYFDNSKDFKQNYKELISEIKKVTPKANIYIESPLPVIDNIAYKAGARLNNKNVMEFRKMAAEVAKEENVNYIDISTLITDQKYYESDGIHLKYDFYPKLLNYVKDVISKSQSNK